MPKNTLSDDAYEIILQKIITGEYPPGSWINEEQLVNELGISRTPIRTALTQLQQGHLVKIISKRGVRVTPITLQYIQELFDLRALFENHALQTYGLKFPKDRLMYYYNAFTQPQDQNEVFRNDVAFHREILLLTGNKLFIHYYDDLLNQMARITNLCGLLLDNRLKLSNQEHLDIIMALLKDDIEQAMEAHMHHLRMGRESAYTAILSDMNVTSSEDPLK